MLNFSKNLHHHPEDKLHKDKKKGRGISSLEKQKLIIILFASSEN